MPRKKSNPAYHKKRPYGGPCLPYQNLPPRGPDELTMEEVFRKACGSNNELADHLVSLLEVVKEK